MLLVYIDTFQEWDAITFYFIAPQCCLYLTHKISHDCTFNNFLTDLTIVDSKNTSASPSCPLL